MCATNLSTLQAEILFDLLLLGLKTLLLYLPNQRNKRSLISTSMSEAIKTPGNEHAQASDSYCSTSYLGRFLAMPIPKYHPLAPH